MKLVLRFFFFFGFGGGGDRNLPAVPSSRSPVPTAMKKRSRSFDSLLRRLAQRPLLSLSMQQNWNSHSGKRAVLPDTSRQVMLFTPCHIVSINREMFKFLIRCQEPGLRELTVAIFPSGGPDVCVTAMIEYRRVSHARLPVTTSVENGDADGIGRPPCRSLAKLFLLV